MKIVTSQEAVQIEQDAQERFDLDALALMERAGERLAVRARIFLPGDRRARVMVLAGGGKNGGDGLVCARYLAQAGVEVFVLLLGGNRLAPETQQNLRRLRRTPAVVHTAADRVPAEWTEGLFSSDLVVDALLGIGLKGPVREPVAGVIRTLNSTGLTVLSADVPSGLDADSGEAAQPTVRADWTLTFGLPKRGLLLPRAAEFVGRLEVDTLGLPSELVVGRGEPLNYLGPAEAGCLLPRRLMTAHKRSVGRVLVIGGSAAYHGAPVLAAAGAVRAGAGYVTVAYPRPLDPVLRPLFLEELCLPLPAAQGRLGAKALAPLLAAARDADAVVLGPGLGRAPETLRLVRAFLARVRGPRAVVVDADALVAVAGRRVQGAAKNAPVLVLTPHEGEAGRMLGQPAEAVARDRWDAVQVLARQTGAIVLLKGRHSAVAAPGGPVWIVGAGTPALATAGTGDVLAGVVAALCAQKVVPRDAAALGAYLHGLAGELASPDPGGLGVRARDVAAQIPYAIRRLRTRCRRSLESL